MYNNNHGYDAPSSSDDYDISPLKRGFQDTPKPSKYGIVDLGSSDEEGQYYLNTSSNYQPSTKNVASYPFESKTEKDKNSAAQSLED